MASCSGAFREPGKNAEKERRLIENPKVDTSVTKWSLKIFLEWLNGRKNTDPAIELCAFTTDKSKLQLLVTTIANIAAKSLKLLLIKFVEKQSLILCNSKYTVCVNNWVIPWKQERKKTKNTQHFLKCKIALTVAQDGWRSSLLLCVMKFFSINRTCIIFERLWGFPIVGFQICNSPKIKVKLEFFYLPLCKANNMPSWFFSFDFQNVNYPSCETFSISSRSIYKVCLSRRRHATQRNDGLWAREV